MASPIFCFIGEIMLTATTKLQAVNEVLSAAGEDRVNSINTPEADEAEQFLDQKSREVQQRGWWFNTTHNRTVVPDDQGHINLPANVLKVLPDDGRYVIRGTKLYDAYGNGLVFTDPVVLTFVEGLDWEELPETARVFIYHAAGRKFQSRILGDPNAATEQSQEELSAFQELVVTDINSTNSNVLYNRDIQRDLLRGSMTRARYGHFEGNHFYGNI